jgi:chromate transporter
VTRTCGVYGGTAAWPVAKKANAAILATPNNFTYGAPVPEETASKPSFATALWFWLKLGFVSFGGPSGQIAIMHEELVERKRWISEPRFLHALTFCMLLPGPEAQQLAIYCGWLLHRTWGGIVAGALFVIPSALLLWLLSYAYVVYGQVPWISAVFYGLKPAVVAIVAAAVIRIGRKALKNEAFWAIALLAFVAIFFGRWPFPLIILLAAVIGCAGSRWCPGKFVTEANSSERGDNITAHTRPSWARALRIIAAGVPLWWAPVLVAGWLGGTNATLFQQGTFFSKAAMTTFGGAYAVLPYVSQQAVERFQWLDASQMVDGLGLAESTPGPLIMVLQFVGFLGAWNHPDGLPRLAAATLGAAITTWTTFVPCFLWIFLGAPHIEQLRGNRRLSGALSAITAAVVGVILNLAVWFAKQVFWPESGRFDCFAFGVCAVVFGGIVSRKWNVIAVVIGSGIVGLFAQGMLHWL